MLLELANAHHAESRAHGWLIKLFHFVLAAKDVNVSSGQLLVFPVDMGEPVFRAAGCLPSERLHSDHRRRSLGRRRGHFDTVLAPFLRQYALQSIHSACPVSARISLATRHGGLRKLLLSCRIEESLLRSTVRCIHSEYLQYIRAVDKRSRQMGAPLVLSDYCVVCSERHHNRSFVLFR